MFQYELNKHRKIPNNKTQHINDEIMKKHEKFIYLKPLI